MKVNVFESFKSFNHLLETMESRPLNRAFKDYERISSQRDESKHDDPWTGTKTYSEAMQIIEAGYMEPLAEMKKAILDIGKKEQNNRPKTKNDFVGFAPHVPNAIIGLPMSMLNKEKRPNKPKTIHLFYSYGVASNVTPREMIRGGINFISLVNSLEKQGYRVKIDMLASFVTSKTMATMAVNVKDYGHKLNLLKLTFPLVHPSMLRRISFKWLETTPDLKDKDFNAGYGTPLFHLMNKDIKREADYLKEMKILKGRETYYCNVYEAMKHSTPALLAQAVGITK